MKHVIKSDNFANFNALWKNLGEKLSELGEVVVKSKIRMTAYNNDYDSYVARYVAKVWTRRGEGGTR